MASSGASYTKLEAIAKARVTCAESRKGRARTPKGARRAFAITFATQKCGFLRGQDTLEARACANPAPDLWCRVGR